MITDVIQEKNLDFSPAMMEIAKSVNDAMPRDILPCCQVTCSDSLCSSVMIRASYTPQEAWTNGIFQNSRYFQAKVSPPKGARYYNGEDRVTVEVFVTSYELGKKFRKYTGPIEKCIEKLVNWVKKIDEDFQEI